MASKAQRTDFMKNWLPRLLSMNTTKAEAETLRARFKAVLATMGAWPDMGAIEIGCPHCVWSKRQGRFRCSMCRYRESFPELPRPYPCTRIPFLGIAADGLAHLTLGADFIRLHWGWRREERKLRDFCEGHLIWADAVLEGKG